MSKKFQRRLVPFIVLGVPVLLLLFLKLGKNKYAELPYYGNSALNSQGDTVRHTVPPFSFTGQDGNAFGSKDLAGKTYIAEFFFTRCPSICPVMQKNLQKVLEAYPLKASTKDLAIVSFSVDPANDNPAILSQYAHKNNITDKRWHFLSGNKDSLYDLMNTKGFLILKPLPADDPAQFNHSGILSLVDKDGHIRGQYDGTKEEDVEKLIDEIRVLLLSYAKH
jgi:protein SCO1/2